MRRVLKKYLLPYLVFSIYQILRLTWRVTYVEPPEMVSAIAERKPIILAFWHGDEIALIHAAKRYRILTMTSISQDGELMDRVLKLLGGQTSRGSSSRQAISGLKGLLRLVKEGRGVPVLAVDGPKGPRHVVKPGVFELSRLLHAPIFCAGVAVSRAWHFPKSWNQTYLPKPFSRIVVSWSLAFSPITRNLDPRDASLAEHLKAQLDDTHHHAAKLIAPPFS